MTKFFNQMKVQHFLTVDLPVQKIGSKQAGAVTPSFPEYLQQAREEAVSRTHNTDSDSVASMFCPTGYKFSDSDSSIPVKLEDDHFF